MKKINILLLGILTMLCACVFSACGKEVEFGFKNDYVELSIGDKIDIEEYFILENVGFNEITFTSLDTSVAVVTTDKNIHAVDNGTTFIQAKFNNKKTNLEIKVKNAPIVPECPSGLKFDETQNSIVWNPQFVICENEVLSINSYTVKVERNGVATEDVVIGQTSYKISLDGECSYSVMCNELLSESGSTIYKDSDYCESIVVNKLKSVTNISYNDQTNMLSWDCDDIGVKQYVVSVNGVLSEVVDEKTISIDLVKENISKHETFNIIVFSLNNDYEGNVCTAQSEVLTLTRLCVPELSVKNGVVSWDETVVGRFHYELCITNQTTDETQTCTVSNGEFNFSNMIEVGDLYSVTMSIISDDTSLLSSVNVQIIENIYKLASTEISFNSETNEIICTDFENKKINLEMIYNNEKTNEYFENGKVLFNQTNPGEYVFKAVNETQTDLEIASSYSNELRIIVLDKADKEGISHYVDELDNYIFTFDTVENADSYDFKYYYNDDEENATALVYEDDSFGKASDLFNSDYKYTVVVKAYSSLSGNENTYIIPSYQSVNIYRLGSATISVDEQINTQVLSWINVENSGGYKISIVRDGEEFYSSITTQLSLNVDGYPFGEYYANIKTLAYNPANINVKVYTRGGDLYLDGLVINSVDFNIYETLTAPTFVLDRQNNILKVGKVKNATGVAITLNEEELIENITEEQDCLVIDLSEIVVESGEYIFGAVSQNKEDEHLLDSSISLFNITKLDAPTRVSLNKNGEIEALDMPLGVNEENGQLVVIDDIPADKIEGENSTYAVKVKFVASEIMQNNVNYFDSDFVDFSVTRKQTPTCPIINLEKLEWEYLEDEQFHNIVCIYQNGIDYINEFDCASPFDLLNLSQIDYSSDFEVAVYYEKQTEEFVIAEDLVIEYTSLISDKVTVHKISNEIDILVTEQDDGVNISWGEAEQEEANYKLSVDSDVCYDGNENLFVSNEIFTEEKLYEIKLVVSKNGYLNSDETIVYLTRLSSDVSVFVDKDENITAKTKLTKEINDKQVDLIELKYNNNIISNLSEIDNEFSINLQVIAKQNEMGESEFYLDSKVVTYNFDRIEEINAPQTGKVISYDESEYFDSYCIDIFSDTDEVFFSTISQSYDISGVDEQTLIRDLNSNVLKVKVKAIRNAFEFEKGQTEWLSSRYSESSNLYLLNNATNVQISTTNDYIQSPITISFNGDVSEAVLSGFLFKIYLDNQEINYLINDVYSPALLPVTENEEGIYSTSELTKYFTAAGQYKIEIYTLEGESSLAPCETDCSITFTKLDCPKNISVSKQAIVSWDSVENASGYAVKYFYSNEISGIIENITETSLDLSTYLPASNFYGEIIVNMLTIGSKATDELKTVSSFLSEDVICYKENIGEIIFDVDKITIGGNFENTDNLIFNLEISNNGQLVKVLNLNYGDEYYYEDWEYINTRQKVSSVTEQEFVFELVTTSDNANHINSATINKSVIRLPQIKNYGFTKINKNINFVCDEMEHSTKIIFSVGEYKTFDFICTEGVNKLNLDMKLNNFAKSWICNVYAQGVIAPEGTSYINSVTTTLNGTKLEEVSNLRVQNGKVQWDKNVLASDYRLIANDSVFENYVVEGVHTTSDVLAGFGGNVNVNVKAIGNLTTGISNSNIILDSMFNITAEITRNDLRVYKILAPTDLKVTEGYISLSYVEKGEKYFASIDGQSYELSEISLTNSIAYLYSQDMYDKLSSGRNYNLSIYVTSELSNVVMSDNSSPIIINILNNGASNSLQIIKKVKSESPLLLDHTINELIWDEDSNAVNGYKVFINDNFELTSTNSLVLTNLDYISANETYYVKLCVCGTSIKDSENVYYLNSKFTEDDVSFKKLNAPNPFIVMGVLCWGEVEDATGYYVYLDGEQINENMITSDSYVFDVASQGSNKTYDTYEVVAVSTSNDLIASAKGIYSDVENEPIAVTKLKAPQNFLVTNGSLNWVVDYMTMLNFGFNNIITNPFTVSIDSITNEFVKLKFKNVNSNDELLYTTEAAKFIALSSEQADLIMQIDGYDESKFGDLVNYRGWPNETLSFYNFANSLPAGEYDLSLSQNGNSINNITSNFGDTQRVYIPYAPQIKIEFISNEYILKWNNIIVPSNYMASEDVTYTIAGIDINDEIRIITTTTNNSLNLTTLIQNEQLDENTKKIIVYVNGNNDKVLNGKISNEISVVVLNKSVASVHNGELSWTAQTSASGYYVYYYPQTDSLQETRLFVNQASWDCGVLSSDIDYYTMHIQAVGVEMNSNTQIVLSGKKSCIGKISKLISPSLNYNDGLISWTNIVNATSYYGTVNAYQGDLLGNPSVSIAEQVMVQGELLEGTCYYENNFYGTRNEYMFKSIGTLDEVLSESTLCYVNSNSSNTLHGIALEQIEGVEINSGKIKWDALWFNENYIKDYKLTFNKLDQNGNSINQKVVLFVNDVQISGQDYCIYDCSEDIQPGRYEITIQAYFLTTDTLKSYDENSETVYYLIGEPSQEFEFTKLDQVDNIHIENSVIYWDYSDVISSDLCQFELTFNGTDRIIKTTPSCSFDDCITDSLIMKDYTLTIRVIPLSPNESITNSAYKDYESENTLNIITQLTAIQENQIMIMQVEGEDEGFIKWENYNCGIENLDVKYIVDYWTDEENILSLETIEKYVKTTDVNFSQNSNTVIKYTIRVVPLGPYDYIKSVPSPVCELVKPDPVTQVMYDQTSNVFSWTNYASSKDHVFKIVDNIIKTDENGQPLYNEDGTYQILRSYTFVTENSNTYTYVPLELGYHTVCVAVIIKNSQEEGGMISNYVYYYAEDITLAEMGVVVEVGLFEGTGTGTSENPYLITNENQFNNLIYRLNKPDYENKYNLFVGEEKTTVNYTSGLNTKFNFKQVNNLSNVVSISGTDSFRTFNGNYDGNNLTLNWKADLSKVPSYGVLSLFGYIGTSGSVSNMKLTSTFINSPTSILTIANLAYQNNGTISNIYIGDGTTINISSKYNLNVSMLVYMNNGLISNVANFYNIALVSNIGISGISLYFGGISYINLDTISKCANYGTINLTSSHIIAGGITAQNGKPNSDDGIIEECVYSANSIKVDVNKTGNENKETRIYVGGLVGENKATINNCYVQTMLEAKKNIVSSTTPLVNMAGICGSSEKSNITYSYVNVTKSSSSINDGIYQVVATMSQSADNSGISVQYKVQSNFTSDNDDKFAPTSYSSYPSHDYLKECFTNTITSMPKLVWENIFINHWDSI